MQKDVEVTERLKQVLAEMKYQDSIIGGLQCQMDMISAALNKVLSNPEPSKEADQGTVDPVLCPLAEQIRDHNRRLQGIDAVIIRLLATLEV